MHCSALYKMDSRRLQLQCSQVPSPHLTPPNSPCLSQEEDGARSLPRRGQPADCVRSAHGQLERTLVIVMGLIRALAINGGRTFFILFCCSLKPQTAVSVLQSTTQCSMNLQSTAIRPDQRIEWQTAEQPMNTTVHVQMHVASIELHCFVLYFIVLDGIVLYHIGLYGTFMACIIVQWWPVLFSGGLHFAVMGCIIMQCWPELFSGGLYCNGAPVLPVCPGSGHQSAAEISSSD